MSSQTPDPTPRGAAVPPALGARARGLILVAAFLGWFFGGVQIAITNLAMRSAAIDLMDRAGELDLGRMNALNATPGAPDELPAADRAQLEEWNKRAARWYTWYQCAFLFGAAAGGYLFGRAGDRLGRSRALGLSIAWFSVFSGLSYFAGSPLQLLVLRAVACLGIGGTWPNGVALLAEAWPGAGRPIVSGSIGMAGNLGIFTLSRAALTYEVTPESWRWVMLVGAAPLFLAVFVWLAVPESPGWLASRGRGRGGGSSEDAGRDEGGGGESGGGGGGQRDAGGASEPAGAAAVFRSPYLGVTVVGIVLATVPLIGGWGSANWMIPWADEVGAAAETPDPFLKAQIGQARSLTSIVGSFLGGWLASLIGRRRCYFLTCLGALLVAQYAFWFTVPTDDGFLLWVSALGFFNGVFFGWLPFFLPELFPTRVRSTGTGVSFNFGRILTGATLVATGLLMGVFEGDYARIGRVTSLVFALGMVAVCFAPDTSQRRMEE